MKDARLVNVFIAENVNRCLFTVGIRLRVDGEDVSPIVFSVEYVEEGMRLSTWATVAMQARALIKAATGEDVKLTKWPRLWTWQSAAERKREVRI